MSFVGISLSTVPRSPQELGQKTSVRGPKKLALLFGQRQKRPNFKIRANKLHRTVLKCRGACCPHYFATSPLYRLHSLMPSPWLRRYRYRPKACACTLPMHSHGQRKAMPLSRVKARIGETSRETHDFGPKGPTQLHIRSRPETPQELKESPCLYRESCIVSHVSCSESCLIQ